MKKQYSYTVLRYIHDITTEEFINIGVVLYSPQEKFLSAACTNKYGRLSRMFFDVEGDRFKQVVKYIQDQINELGGRIHQELEFEKLPDSVNKIVGKILPPDDGSLQFSDAGKGVAENLSETLDELFVRYVTKYLEQPDLRSRSDEEVLKSFKKKFVEKGILDALKPFKVESKDDEQEFPYAWKNSTWHVLQPLSFDLVKPDSIIQKARTWLGVGYSLLRPEEVKKRIKEGVTLNFLLGAPKEQKLLNYFNKAKSILSKIPCEHKFIHEEEAANFAEEIKRDMENH